MLGSDDETAEPEAASEDLDMEFDIGDEAEVDAAEDNSEIDFGAEFEAALEEADDLDVDESELIPFEDSIEDDELTGEAARDPSGIPLAASSILP